VNGASPNGLDHENRSSLPLALFNERRDIAETLVTQRCDPAFWARQMGY